jgi:hypothetical protein
MALIQTWTSWTTGEGNSVNQYELDHLERIKQNEAYFLSLGLQPISSIKNQDRKRQDKKHVQPTSKIPTRRSSRTRMRVDRLHVESFITMNGLKKPETVVGDDCALQDAGG